MKKKRIAAAGLAVIMALTAAGCHQTSKEDTAQTTVKENRDEKDTSKEQIEKEETEKKVLHPYIHTDSVSAVSYTHLDVYKRQVLCRAVRIYKLQWYQ